MTHLRLSGAKGSSLTSLVGSWSRGVAAFANSRARARKHYPSSPPQLSNHIVKTTLSF
jgi:hypothetical protein